MSDHSQFVDKYDAKLFKLEQEKIPAAIRRLHALGKFPKRRVIESYILKATSAVTATHELFRKLNEAQEDGEKTKEIRRLIENTLEDAKMNLTKVDHRLDIAEKAAVAEAV